MLVQDFSDLLIFLVSKYCSIFVTQKTHLSTVLFFLNHEISGITQPRDRYIWCLPNLLQHNLVCSCLKARLSICFYLNFPVFKRFQVDNYDSAESWAKSEAVRWMDDASTATAETWKPGPWDGLSKQAWRLCLLPAQPPSRTRPDSGYCPCLAFRASSGSPGWPRESHRSLLNKQLSLCSIYTGLSIDNGTEQDAS